MYSQTELEAKLSELTSKHNVPGAQLAVLDGDEIVESAAGVLSLRTGCPTTTDALFLPGSIGKLYTATLVLMLVQDGRLDLDTPIRAYLPEFGVQDEQAAEVVTPRNLLSHTSGFDGDHFTDTGRGDDGLALYVAGCADLPQIAPPGLIWSYSNSGYSILGRIVEVLHGDTFENVLKERIFEPLGLEHTVSFADEAIVHPVSVGHDPDQELAAAGRGLAVGSGARLRPDGGGRDRQRRGRAPLRPDLTSAAVRCSTRVSSRPCRRSRSSSSTISWVAPGGWAGSSTAGARST